MGDADVVVHGFLRHLEKVVPGNPSYFVLLYGSVQVALRRGFVPTRVGHHPLAAFHHPSRGNLALLHDVGVVSARLFGRLIVSDGLNGLIALLEHLTDVVLRSDVLDFRLRLQFLGEVLVDFYAQSAFVQIDVVSFDDGVVLGLDERLEDDLLETYCMHNDLEDFDELLLVNKILGEAELFDGSEDLQFLVDFELDVQILENLHNFVVVHGGVALLPLLEAEPLRLLAGPYLQPPVDLIQLMRNFVVYPEVFWVVLHPLLIFFTIYFFVFYPGDLGVVPAGLISQLGRVDADLFVQILEEELVGDCAVGDFIELRIGSHL